VSQSVYGGAPVHMTADGMKRPFEARELNHAYLVSVGNSRYMVSMTNPDDDGGAQFIMTDNSTRPYVIDLDNVAVRDVPYEPSILRRTRDRAR